VIPVLGGGCLGDPPSDIRMRNTNRLGIVILLACAFLVAATDLPEGNLLTTQDAHSADRDATISSPPANIRSEFDGEYIARYSPEEHEAAKLQVLEAAQRGNLSEVRRRLAQELRKTCSRKNCGDSVSLSVYLLRTPMCSIFSYGSLLECKEIMYQLKSSELH